MTILGRLTAIGAISVAFQAELGVAPLNQTEEGMLDEGLQQAFSIQVIEDISYVLTGTCSGDCVDLDLVLWDPVLQLVVAEDIEADDVPFLWFEPRRTGILDATVKMVRCDEEPCSWTVRTEEVNSGELEEGSVEEITLFLRKGVEYRLRGSCDTDCEDVDLRLDDRSNKTVASDYLADDSPNLVYAPQRTGRFILTVEMVHCDVEPCRWMVALSPE